MKAQTDLNTFTKTLNNSFLSEANGLGFDQPNNK